MPGASHGNWGVWRSQCGVWEGQFRRASVKILRRLEVPKRVFGEPEGAPLQALSPSPSGDASASETRRPKMHGICENYLPVQKFIRENMEWPTKVLIGFGHFWRSKIFGLRFTSLARAYDVHLSRHFRAKYSTSMDGQCSEGTFQVVLAAIFAIVITGIPNTSRKTSTIAAVATWIHSSEISSLDSANRRRDVSFFRSFRMEQCFRMPWSGFSAHVLQSLSTYITYGLALFTRIGLSVELRELLFWNNLE